MKITLNHYDINQTVEIPDDSDTKFVIEVFLGMLATSGYQKGSIDNTLKNISNELGDE